MRDYVRWTGDLDGVIELGPGPLGVFLPKEHLAFLRGAGECS